MKPYSSGMDQRMFDFKSFYANMAEVIPHGAMIAEVGLGDGVSSIFLAETLIKMGKDFKYYLVDNLAYGGSEQLNTIIYHLFQAGVAPYVELLPLESLVASCRFPDFFFDFVFIDASHRFESTKADIRLWWRKIKVGGTLAGHDYNDEEGKEVQTAVNEVIPPDNLQVEVTRKGYGVWRIQKSNFEQTVR